MKNYVQEGENLTVAAPYAVTTGDGCLVGFNLRLRADHRRDRRQRPADDLGRRRRQEDGG